MGNSAANKNVGSVQSVARAMKILKLFKTHEELGITQIAQKLNLSKSTVYGLVQALKVEGFLEKNSNNKSYICGLEAFKLGMSFASRMDLRNISAERARTLSEEVGETVHLSVMLGGRCINVARFNPDRLFMLIPQLGTFIPAHCTAMGKVLLASLNREQLHSTIKEVGLDNYTPYTITSLQDLENQLEKVRQQGYAVSNQEALLGLSCVAAPIRDYTGQVAAAISVAGSTESLMQKDRKEKTIHEVVKAALDISNRLGYEG